MKIALESTGELFVINGAPARMWRGTTARGVRIVAFITSLVADADGDLSELRSELSETDAPHPLPEDTTLRAALYPEEP